MKSMTLTLMVAGALLTGCAIAHANEPSTQSQQNYTVKYEWDSKYVTWKVNGDQEVVDEIMNIISSSVDENLKFEMMAYVRLNKNEYATVGSVAPKDLSSIPFFKRKRYASAVGDYFFVIDISNSGKIVASDRIAHSGGAFGPGRFGSSYGCMQNHIPIFRADLNHDGHPEVFYFTSQPNGITDAYVDSIDLHMLRGTDFQEVWNARLMTDNYTTENTFKYTGGKYAALKLGPSFDTVKPYTPGIKEYSKLYFGDLNGDKKLDLLVWRRNYVALTTWKLNTEQFYLYTMSPDVTFTKTDLTPEQGHALLEKNNLTWKQGFPNQNFCNNAGNPTDKPLITNIGDPVLKQ